MVEDIGRDNGIVQSDAETVDTNMADRLGNNGLMGIGACEGGVAICCSPLEGPMEALSSSYVCGKRKPGCKPGSP